MDNADHFPQEVFDEVYTLYEIVTHVDLKTSWWVSQVLNHREIRHAEVIHIIHPETGDLVRIENAIMTRSYRLVGNAGHRIVVYPESARARLTTVMANAEIRRGFWYAEFEGAKVAVFSNPTVCDESNYVDITPR